MQNPRSITKCIYIFNFAIVRKHYAKGYGITTWYISIIYIYIYIYILSYVNVSYISAYIIHLLYM